MINKDALDKWLKVLRSPLSQRTKGKLENGVYSEARCCLGHLCHALDVPRHQIDGEGGLVEYGNADDGDASWSELPEYVAEDIGISTDGEFRSLVSYKGTHYVSLADLNDSTKITPQEIADIIEREAKADNLEPYGI